MFPFLELYLECVFVIKNKKKAMENKIWRCSSDGKENIVDRLISESGVVRSVALYLASRGITPETLGRYLNATFADLSDPFRFICTGPVPRRETISMNLEYKNMRASAVICSRSLSTNLSSGGMKARFMALPRMKNC